MLRSSKFYIEKHKDDNLDQLIKIKNLVVKSLNELEQIRLDPNNMERYTKPSIELRYKNSLETLIGICELLKEKCNNVGDFLNEKKLI